MLKLIAWVLAVYWLAQLWTGIRARRRQRTAHGVEEGRTKNSGIDRSQVVDAEFTDMDGGPESGR